MPMGYQLLWSSADDSAAAESYGCGSTVNRCQRFNSGSESGSRWGIEAIPIKPLLTRRSCPGD